MLPRFKLIKIEAFCKKIVSKKIKMRLQEVLSMSEASLEDLLVSHPTCLFTIGSPTVTDVSGKQRNFGGFSK